MSIAAFFDLDRTLIDVNSGRRWLVHEWKTGQLPPAAALRYIKWLFAYHWGLLDIEQATRFTLRRLAGRDAAELAREYGEWSRSSIFPRVCIEAVAAIEDHRDQGHVLAVLTAGARFSAHPLGEALAIDHLLCTELEVRDGRLTGELDGRVCYGNGKVARAETFAADHGIDLDASYFYSDSISDLPMLERVGHPRVVNPDGRLGGIARARGWPVLRWRHDPRGPIIDLRAPRAPNPASAPCDSSRAEG